MQEFIIEQTNKIFSKCIKKFSQTDKVEQNEVSILMNLKGEEREVSFQICHHHLPVKEVTMLNVLGVKIDIKGFSIIVPPQIKKIIEGFEVEVGSKNIELCVYLNREEDDEVRYFLYNDGAYLREVFLKDVLKLE